MKAALFKIRERYHKSKLLDSSSRDYCRLCVKTLYLGQIPVTAWHNMLKFQLTIIYRLLKILFISMSYHIISY